MSKLTSFGTKKVAEALSKIPQPDQDKWHALFCAAMDEVGDVDKAIEAANALYSKVEE